MSNKNTLRNVAVLAVDKYCIDHTEPTLSGAVNAGLAPWPDVAAAPVDLTGQDRLAIADEVVAAVAMWMCSDQGVEIWAEGGFLALIGEMEEASYKAEGSILARRKALKEIDSES